MVFSEDVLGEFSRHLAIDRVLSDRNLAAPRVYRNDRADVAWGQQSDQMHCGLQIDNGISIAPQR